MRRDGQVERSWPSIASGRQQSSIIRALGKLPPLALDPARGRFAVAQDNGIHVVALTT